jgi:hypothetical protein
VNQLFLFIWCFFFLGANQPLPGLVLVGPSDLLEVAYEDQPTGAVNAPVKQSRGKFWLNS